MTLIACTIALLLVGIVLAVGVDTRAGDIGAALGLTAVVVLVALLAREMAL